ncbi:hypothetical protein [Paenibacillus sp. UNC499MF]|uniref:hypothetical protein n=1 Tax=Paenibacillus sp. UNC499MF TaxID=1502751 RepID=UPI000CDF153E|nr:hypothetical protein [Paenibacillus sp. UNC499MF]
MSSFCTVCNGMEALSAVCPHCESGSASDYGRVNDYYGPYAPYRPIEDISMTNGYPDVARNECMHMLYCEACGASSVLAVPESLT